ncbi:MAG: hypothetical protein H0Z24_06795 [Thermosipho sp. (in: Bacteria)]|nr:hypothetical protein [Thermosipho sp. (in: thermotogales)]
MSYSRMPEPHYIYPTGDGVRFDLDYISNDKIDLFLYKLFLKYRRKELIERLKHGRKLARTHIDGNELDGEDKEYWKMHIEWLNNNEDELLRQLLDEK